MHICLRILLRLKLPAELMSNQVSDHCHKLNRFTDQKAASTGFAAISWDDLKHSFYGCAHIMCKQAVVVTKNKFAGLHGSDEKFICFQHHATLSNDSPD